MKFNKKITDTFVDEAILLLEKARSVHDELESYYITAMDFNKVNEIFENLKIEIFGN